MESEMSKGTRLSHPIGESSRVVSVLRLSLHIALSIHVQRDGNLQQPVQCRSDYTEYGDSFLVPALTLQ